MRILEFENFMKYDKVQNADDLRMHLPCIDISNMASILLIAPYMGKPCLVKTRYSKEETEKKILNENFKVISLSSFIGCDNCLDRMKRIRELFHPGDLVLYDMPEWGFDENNQLVRRKRRF